MPRATGQAPAWCHIWSLLIGEILFPPLLISSLIRPVMTTYPSSSRCLFESRAVHQDGNQLGLTLSCKARADGGEVALLPPRAGRRRDPGGSRGRRRLGLAVGNTLVAPGDGVNALAEDEETLVDGRRLDEPLLAIFCPPAVLGPVPTAQVFQCQLRGGLISIFKVIRVPRLLLPLLWKPGPALRRRD
ncbi:hypothetical protein QBC39DRAFT_162965 [Podospora conica]|nr:hypothetical protein QBC39DRAFT_162965 [Schizothecium conicum]